MDAEALLGEARSRVEVALDALLPAEGEPPATLHRAMRYSVFAGGKRLRPALALAAGGLGDLAPERLLPAVAALELIHTYSLVHDDLPAMDDDDLRRGKPTCHVVFGEAHAILAGDALLTLAFEVLATEPRGAALAERRLRAVRAVAAAAGPAGMVGGQIADLEAETPRDGEAESDLRATLAFIHARKTGALLGASCALGGILGGLPEPEVERLDAFGRAIGLAFQIRDDLLDVEGSAGTIGKTAGKDARARKLTYPALYGLAGSRREADAAIERALRLIEPLGDAALALRTLAHFILARQS